MGGAPVLAPGALKMMTKLSGGIPLTRTHIILLEGPPTPLAGPLRPGWEALAPPTPRPAALPTPGPPVP